MSRSWDVFCRVVDNFGDAAVCWRLASQLAGEHGGRVRLWIDSLPALQSLRPAIATNRARQVMDGVEVCEWTQDAAFGAPAEIVIEAFGGGLPEAYVDSMAQASPGPLWIILEYLSAEAWVGSHHGLPSPHPRLPLQRHFFFPGIVAGTGGVLHEATLEPRRRHFEADPQARSRFWIGLGFGLPVRGARVVSLFGYPNPAAGELLDAFAQSGEATVVAVPPGGLRAQVCAWLGSADPGDDTTLARDGLEIRLLPFLAQPAYDELLWASDWNFVRGEDSFLRAQWARRPFTWHIYPQAERAHGVKLDAFMEKYCAGLEPGTSSAMCALADAWNAPAGTREGRLGEAWRFLSTRQPELRRHADDWATRLAQVGDLAANLAQFCAERLK